MAVLQLLGIHITARASTELGSLLGVSTVRERSKNTEQYCKGFLCPRHCHRCPLPWQTGGQCKQTGLQQPNRGCGSEQGPRCWPCWEAMPCPQTCKLSTGRGPERESGLAGTSQQLHPWPHPQPWSQSRAALLFELGGYCPFEGLFIHPPG